MKEKEEGREHIRRQTRIRTMIGLNAGVAIALLAALVVMLNYLSYRHHVRVDWSRTKYYALSEKTHSLLNSLTNAIDVIVFFQPGQEVYQDIRNLLKEYENACRHLQVEWVDPDRDLARTEELAARYDVAQANVVVFDTGKRSKYVMTTDIVEYDYNPVRYGQQPQMTGFKGEQAFSSAIQSITQARKPIVFFLQGHGEADIEDYDKHAGFSDIARFIRRDNIEIRTFIFGEERQIPEDCDALIVAGPETPLFGAELDLLTEYLEHNGRLMLLLDSRSESGLSPLLEDWGVRLGDDIVVDATRTLTGGELFITKQQYGSHPITEAISEMTSILYLPRSVEPLKSMNGASTAADKPHVAILVSCSESGWAESELKDGVMEFNPQSDKPGPISVGVAVERGPVPGIDVQIKPTRLVVIGDSGFAANGSMSGGNADFFMSALNWLMEREELMAISPKEVKKSQLIMSRKQLSVLFWAVVFGLPGGFAFIGAAVWFRRRN